MRLKMRSGVLSPREPGSLVTVVESLAERFSSHPGFMWTEEGFTILHADWPAYPKGPGYKYALAALADAGYLFYPIDNIDKCTLFLVDREPARTSNKYDPTLYHVAAWDDDLRECYRRGFITGLNDLEEEQLSFPSGVIELTGKAYAAVLVHDLTFDLAPSLLARIEHPMYESRFDTAVREASILLEESIRRSVGASRKQYGLDLVEQLLGKKSSLVPPSMTNAERLELRNEFRLFFKHVRNPISHGDLNIDVVTCARLLRRCSNLLKVLEHLGPSETGDA